MDAERMDLAGRERGRGALPLGIHADGRSGSGACERRGVCCATGKRLTFSVWGPPERNPWAAISGAAMVAHGHMPPPEPGTPGMFAMAEEARIRELVTDAGFEDPRLEEVAVEWSFEDLDAYWSFVSKMRRRAGDGDRDALRRRARGGPGDDAGGSRAVPDGVRLQTAGAVSQCGDVVALDGRFGTRSAPASARPSKSFPERMRSAISFDSAAVDRAVLELDRGIEPLPGQALEVVALAAAKRALHAAD